MEDSSSLRVMLFFGTLLVLFLELQITGVFKKVLLVFFVGLFAWAYQAARPHPPKTCGSVNGPPVTVPRIRLRDGRHLAYKEHGVAKDKAKHNIVFVHEFDCCRHDTAIIPTLSQTLFNRSKLPPEMP